MTKVKPSRVCPECKKPIEGKTVVMDHREYCSSDCLLKAYDRKKETK